MGGDGELGSVGRLAVVAEKGPGVMYDPVQHRNLVGHALDQVVDLGRDHEVCDDKARVAAG